MKQTDSAAESRSRGGNRGWLRFLPAIAWMAIIFAFSSRTGDELGTVLPWFQKLFPFMTSFDWGHFVSYFVLGLTFDYAFGRRSDRVMGKVFIVMLCTLYGISDEYHQSFVGGRSPDIYDVRNDAIGAALAVIVTSIPFVRNRWRKIAS
ncbi:VanZ family protein [Paenibacillus mendelii]|uniref:VanZ family protein n=1 Tax=Paenibacillus mendelii TaxID=206163 RepID=A0ABV6J4V0_9BACL|nr:VanZ family protein [Paenibacillus mendelii]MCQ6560393.1 VanZ family protein [Paenibacillus mendelii]